MDGVSIGIEGDKRLQRKLAALERRDKTKIVKKGLREASKILRDAARQNARSMVGGQMGSLLARTLKYYMLRMRRRDLYGMQVRHKADVPELVDTTKDDQKYYIPAAIEYGHALPGYGGSGRKDVGPIPYVRRAYDEKEDAAKLAFEACLRRQVEAVFRG